VGRGVDAVVGVHSKGSRAGGRGVCGELWGWGGFGEAAVEAGGDVGDGVGEVG